MPSAFATGASPTPVPHALAFILTDALMSLLLALEEIFHLITNAVEEGNFEEFVRTHAAKPELEEDDDKNENHKGDQKEKSKKREGNRKIGKNEKNKGKEKKNTKKDKVNREKELDRVEEEESVSSTESEEI